MTQGKESKLQHATCGSASHPQFLLGRPERYGFNQQQMDEVCRGDGLVEDDSAKYNKCEVQATLIDKIAEKAPEFVSQIQVFKAEQLKFRATMADKSNEFQAKLESKDFQDKIIEKSDKVRYLTEEFSAFSRDFTTLSGSGEDLQAAMDTVKRRGEEPNQTVDQRLALFEEFISNCNVLMTARGGSKEYLLDICSQQGDACIQDAVGKHVGCCCAFTPIISPKFEIDGVSAEEVENGNVARRLQNQPGGLRISSRYGQGKSDRT